jgi:signal transduction histidine kinase
VKAEAGDLNELVDRALEDFQSCYKVAIERNLQPVPLAAIDSEQLQSVINNLLLNANEATGGQGMIQVATSSMDHQIIVAVTDNGSGMSRQFIDKMLFRPFSSTKKRGMGIGLFHCKMIVEAHKGRIEVDSEEGKGTTFRVILPI